MTEQIKSTLGPERAADYERATDPSYRHTQQIISRFGLPPETTNQLWAVQTELETRRRAIPLTVPTPERLQTLASLRQEAIARITPLLGTPRALDAYQQHAGQWLQDYAARQTPAPPKN